MKNLLYVHMDFYEYESRIVQALKNSGFNVISFHDKNCISLFDRIIKRLFKSSFFSRRKNKRRQLQFLKRLKKECDSFDVVFIIVGRYLEAPFFEQIKSFYPEAKIILYLWDDLSRVPLFSDSCRFYDKIFSFDSNDCLKYGFTFLPLFFVDDFLYNEETKKYKLFLTGIDHSQRSNIIDNIYKNENELYSESYFYLFSSRYMQFKRRIKHLFLKKESNYIHYDRLSLNDVATLTKQSLCLVDIQYKEQAGLSLRTFESIASHCKLITTNENVKKYDFYNPNNIMIISRDLKEFKVDCDFINAPYQIIDETIVKKYSIHSWVDFILNNI